MQDNTLTNGLRIGGDEVAPPMRGTEPAKSFFPADAGAREAQRHFESARNTASLARAERDRLLRQGGQR